MREIDVGIITDNIKEMCIESNKRLPKDLVECFKTCGKAETTPLARFVFDDMFNNIAAAEELDIPICQDTGMAVIFAEIGQDVHFTGGSFRESVDEGVRRGYLEGYLRCSIVEDPLKRKNTGDNTPAVLHLSIVPGDRIKLTVSPKGFGSENMSAIKMFNPSATREDIVAFVTDVADKAGSNPCPPIVVGIGIGGDFEYSALLAKRALCRSVSQRNNDPFYSQMEKDILQSINKLKIGPQGFGGNTTALACNIEVYPTHIAGLPVAVNMGCNVTRHISRDI